MLLLRFFQVGILLCIVSACTTVPPAQEPVRVQVQAQKPALPPGLAESLERLAIPATALSIYVQEVDSGKLTTAFNSTAPFNPASTMKLVTTNAALELLGPTFSWTTQAYIDGVLQGDVLYGDLIIKGSGDPKLMPEHLWMFLRQIRAKGIRDIRGKLQLDRSMFEEGAYDAAAFDGDPLKPYNVGPDALLLNYKALTLRFLPDGVSQSARVLVEPGLVDYPVTAPRLVNGDCGDWKARLQPQFDAGGVVFPGTYSLSCGEKTWNVHPYTLSHSQYFAAVFRQIWNELGGSIQGETAAGTVPSSAQLIAEWQSAALSEIVRDINKYSNNVMARQLLYNLGAASGTLPATAQSGADAVRAWLSSKGLDASEVVIENGSGLSRNERISAATLGRMLSLAYRSPLMPELISSMPLVGYDGSMRRRLQNNGITGRAHIKTGTLVDVRSIAGYVLAQSGKRYAVVSIINHPNAPVAQELHDALLQWVYEQG
ncbi:MAG: D-alanyl-D-alanine carboxypeptidase/D-alanyl-D-alanine endopeptidase [Burkholderiaceae bacterium]